jgi:hypothetical protein
MVHISNGTMTYARGLRMSRSAIQPAHVKSETFLSFSIWLRASTVAPGTCYASDSLRYAREFLCWHGRVI